MSINNTSTNGARARTRTARSWSARQRVWANDTDSHPCDTQHERTKRPAKRRSHTHNAYYTIAVLSDLTGGRRGRAADRAVGEVCGGDGEVEEQSHLQDREGGLRLGQPRHQPRGQADAPPLGVHSHPGGLQQERRQVQKIEEPKQYF